MFGREKSAVEDVFETEERLSAELTEARKQRQETTAKFTELDMQYRLAASAALATGDPEAALALRDQMDQQDIRKVGLGQRILDLEPKYQEAVRLGQAERIRITQAERRDKFQQLIGRGRAAAQRVVEKHEEFMRAISALDGCREELFAPELQSLGGAHECEELGKLIFQPDGLPGLHGRLMAQGWTLRTAIQPTYLEIVGVKAPEK